MIGCTGESGCKFGINYGWVFDKIGSIFGGGGDCNHVCADRRALAQMEERFRRCTSFNCFLGPLPFGAQFPEGLLTEDWRVSATLMMENLRQEIDPKRNKPIQQEVVGTNSTDIEKYQSILHVGGIDLAANAKAAAEMSGAEFVSMVRPTGEWDYKNSPALIAALKSAGIYDPQLLAEFGNWHYGYVAAAHGMDLGTTLLGAGAAQTVLQGGGNWGRMLQGVIFQGRNQEWIEKATLSGFTWGDKPDDSRVILSGWKYYYE